MLMTEAAVPTRVCINPECPRMGKSQPLDAEHFAPIRGSKNRYKRVCRQCETQLDEAGSRICSNPECPHMGKPQPLDAKHFAPGSRYKGGYRQECRTCESKRTSRWQKDNPVRVGNYQKERYHEGREAVRLLRQLQMGWTKQKQHEASDGGGNQQPEDS